VDWCKDYCHRVTTQLQLIIIIIIIIIKGKTFSLHAYGALRVLGGYGFQIP
jgi:hypothetical protein